MTKPQDLEVDHIFMSQYNSHHGGIWLLREIISDRRAYFGWSRREAAEACGLTQDVFIRMEECRKNFSPEEIKALAEGLVLPAGWLFEKAGYS
jgi:transcriptional regulator with XRE-family HTH domain